VDQTSLKEDRNDWEVEGRPYSLAASLVASLAASLAASLVASLAASLVAYTQLKVPVGASLWLSQSFHLTRAIVHRLNYCSPSLYLI
jgi:hypothetical protein